MYCQGMSGAQIADNWRTLHPSAGVSLNLAQYARLYFARSLFTLDAYRKYVFPKWGLDWAKIRASKKEGTFNAYNFSKHRLEVFSPAAMDEDHLCASISLPMWFPPVILGGDTFIDGVYITDGNLEEAIRHGADEIWIIWTVSERGEWDDGFIANYFQIIEASANGRLRQIRDRIEANNAALAIGKPGEFGRAITVKILQAEVDLNYLINFSADLVAEAVNQGVQAARKWCDQNQIAYAPLPDPVPSQAPSPTSLEFTEEMKGFITPGETDYDRGFRTGKINGTEMRVHLTIKTNDVNHFVQSPEHEASAEGYIVCPDFGGERRVLKGVFNLLIATAEPDHKTMNYRLFFTDSQNQPLTLVGIKEIRGDDGSDMWTDTTTLFTRILAGHVQPQDDKGAKILASGIIRIHMLDFLHQLTTFKVEGPTLGGRVGGLCDLDHFSWASYGMFMPIISCPPHPFDRVNVMRNKTWMLSAFLIIALAPQGHASFFGDVWNGVKNVVSAGSRPGLACGDWGELGCRPCAR